MSPPEGYNSPSSSRLRSVSGSGSSASMSAPKSHTSIRSSGSAPKPSRNVLTTVSHTAGRSASGHDGRSASQRPGSFRTRRPHPSWRSTHRCAVSTGHFGDSTRQPSRTARSSAASSSVSVTAAAFVQVGHAGGSRPPGAEAPARRGPSSTARLPPALARPSTVHPQKGGTAVLRYCGTDLLRYGVTAVLLVFTAAVSQ